MILRSPALAEQRYVIDATGTSPQHATMARTSFSVYIIKKLSSLQYILYRASRLAVAA